MTNNDEYCYSVYHKKYIIIIFFNHMSPILYVRNVHGDGSGNIRSKYFLSTNNSPSVLTNL